MSDDEAGYSVGNKDSNARGRNLPRQDRESDQSAEDERQVQRLRGVIFGDVTEDPKKR